MAQGLYPAEQLSVNRTAQIEGMTRERSVGPESNRDFSPSDPSKLVATVAQLFVDEVIKRYVSELVQRSKRRFDGIYHFAGIGVLLRSVHLS